MCVCDAVYDALRQSVINIDHHLLVHNQVFPADPSRNIDRVTFGTVSLGGNGVSETICTFSVSLCSDRVLFGLAPRTGSGVRLSAAIEDGDSFEVILSEFKAALFEALKGHVQCYAAFAATIPDSFSSGPGPASTA